MPKAILYVESRPSSPQVAGEYHRWYVETHIAEMLDIDGIVSARRLEPVDRDGSFIALYEIEADDLAVVQARMRERASSGGMSKPVAVQSDPPPTMRMLREMSVHTQ